ncbi:hypothetical protein [Xenophilus sp. Marseille-Q4582]|uniref:hypothetical protein n=1 Tax=Xenophilus sp. Marseille-Q4582 TaxID=2866600 RepID=UPI001CE4664C|nr:hypothetical protein [Xenophilus sp. Marseille-Q4582]
MARDSERFVVLLGIIETRNRHASHALAIGGLVSLVASLAFGRMPLEGWGLFGAPTFAVLTVLSFIASRSCAVSARRVADIVDAALQVEIAKSGHDVNILDL